MKERINEYHEQEFGQHTLPTLSADQTEFVVPNQLGDRHPEPEGPWTDQPFLKKLMDANVASYSVPLSYQSIQEAFESLPIIKKAGELPEVPSGAMQRELVRVLVAAIRNVESVSEAPGSEAVRAFGVANWDKYWANDRVEAAAWNLLNQIIRYHQKGLAAPPLQGTSQVKPWSWYSNADAQIPFEARVEAIVHVLKKRKQACVDVMDGWKINQLVICPEQYDTRNKGKEAEKEQEAAQKLLGDEATRALFGSAEQPPEQPPSHGQTPQYQQSGSQAQHGSQTQRGSQTPRASQTQRGRGTRGRPRAGRGRRGRQNSRGAAQQDVQAQQLPQDTGLPAQTLQQGGQNPPKHTYAQYVAQLEQGFQQQQQMDNPYHGPSQPLAYPGYQPHQQIPQHQPSQQYGLGGYIEGGTPAQSAWAQGGYGQAQGVYGQAQGGYVQAQGGYVQAQGGYSQAQEPTTGFGDPLDPAAYGTPTTAGPSNWISQYNVQADPTAPTMNYGANIGDLGPSGIQGYLDPAITNEELELFGSGNDLPGYGPPPNPSGLESGEDMENFGLGGAGSSGTKRGRDEEADEGRDDGGSKKRQRQA
ncbi:hypothetical protein BDY21DRAFT_362644 [Lineolata rhizophorae]|uniref:Uncharacterized protein n=1 Tax=Lineolata rhizophorae TaxID=578093 RepID=A0A6A6P590_9PEZI|nr:hypothetical protein BDY21DRAFT_362644 [Lineolata rhizophorae]